MLRRTVEAFVAAERVDRVQVVIGAGQDALIAEATARPGPARRLSPAARRGRIRCVRGLEALGSRCAGFRADP